MAVVKSASRHRPSVRTRLAVLVIASVSVAVAIVTVVTAVREGRREAARQAEQFRAAAAVLASTGAQATAERSAAGAYASLRAIKLLPAVDYARIETLDGRTLAETGSGARLARDASVSDRRRASTASLLSSGTVEVRSPVTHGRQPVGQVVLLGRTSGVRERLLGALGVSLLAGLAAALVGMLVAWRLQRQITGPILALKDSMAAVRATHDYARPAEAPGADAEIAELVDGFNAMLAEIRGRDQEIAGHVEGLERTVAERTADLAAAKDAAESANAAKGDFLATMSHEIRTPMNGIMVMAEMLAAGDLPARQRRFAEVIAKSGSSLLAIINDILDFSKIEAGKMELEAAPTDPAEVVEDVASLFWERARSKGLDLAVFVDPAVPARVLADPTRLRQVVGNLVNNAIKFTEAGGVMVTVEAVDGGRLRFLVRDSGIGIAPEKIGGLFGAFTQADQSITRRFGGTGLGLAICKRLVEAMGADIVVQSQVGRGSVFGFTLKLETVEAAANWPRLEGQAALALEGPCTAAVARRYLTAAGLQPAGLDAAGAVVAIGDAERLEGAARNAAPTLVVGEYGDGRPTALVRQGRAEAVLIQPLRRGDLLRALAQIAAGEALTDPGGADVEAGASLPSFVGRRVLVVDDSAVNREVAIEALSRLGVVCETADDGRQGVAAALAGGFDLVLMDGSMPEMDGYEAAREIRQREGRRTPIVALTAHVVGTAAQAWREAGMDGVLHKPFTLAGLAAVLGQHMEASAETVAGPAAGPAPASEAPVSDLLDPEVVGELAGMAAAGKADFVERVRRLYRENAPLAVETYLEAAAAGDADGGARAAHALKSMSLNIGARAVAQAAGRLEGRARDEGQVTVADGEALKSLLAATLEALEDRAPARKEAPSLSAEDAALTLALAKAVERDEFHLAYQPQFSRDGTQVTGCEALLRWTHPTQGPIGPNRFIPLAERAGLMGPITRWVLRRAMEETADLDGLAVSVNASALDVADPSFVDDLSTILVRLAFPPKRLEVELTETAVLADEAEAKRAIERLQALGVSVALDDFGMGYTSLNQLRLYPFDKLKIDRSFIIGCPADTTSATLVHAVISVGRALGMKVVAEGVETEEQRRFLAVAGVHAFQGYLFAKPMPIEDLRALWVGRLAKAG